MAFKHYAPILNREVEGITFDDPTDRSIFLQCAYWADKRGIIRMPQVEIAEETLYSLATIKRVFGKLESEGLLKRLGHGRYQIIQYDHGETPEDNALKNKLRRWLIDQSGNDILEYGQWTVAIPEIEDLPDFIKTAIHLGILEFTEDVGIAGEDTPYRNFKIHL